jgi:hypothetical protein
MAKPEKVGQGKPGGKTFNHPKAMTNPASGETRLAATFEEMKTAQAEGFVVDDDDDDEVAPAPAPEAPAPEAPPA